MNSKWISVKEHLPKCSHKPDSFGVPVLIWPHHSSPGSADVPYAFYGCRVTNKPNFYIHGRLIDVTHWMPIPPGPEDTK